MSNVLSIEYWPPRPTQLIGMQRSVREGDKYLAIDPGETGAAVVWSKEGRASEPVPLAGGAGYPHAVRLAREHDCRFFLVEGQYVGRDKRAALTLSLRSGVLLGMLLWSQPHLTGAIVLPPTWHQVIPDKPTRRNRAAADAWCMANLDYATYALGHPACRLNKAEASGAAAAAGLAHWYVQHATLELSKSRSESAKKGHVKRTARSLEQL